MAAKARASSLPLKRRALLTKAAAGVAAGAATFSAPAISQGLREWRMVTCWPKGLPGVGTGVERLAANITAMSGGRLAIKVYAAGELVPAFGVFDAVADGTAQMGHDPSYYHIGKSEGAAFFTCFPWGFTANEIEAWIKYGGGQKLWDELYLPFGLRAFLAGNTGTQMFGWVKRELNTVEDFQGLKFRTPGNNARVIQKLGAVPVVIAGGDIFPALQSGAIDGAEWIGPYNDLALGFHQVCRYYYAHGYHEPGPGLELTVNEKAWQSLTPELQEIIRVAADAASRDMTAEYNAHSGPAMRILVEKHGVQVRGLSEPILMALGEKSNEVLNEIYADGDPLVRRIIENFMAFRADVLPWTRVGEQAYMNARRLPFKFGLT